MCQCVEKVNRQVEGPNIITFAFVLVSCVCICIWYCNLCLYCVCRGVEELNWQDEAAMYYLKVTHGCGLWMPPIITCGATWQTSKETKPNKHWLEERHYLKFTHDGGCPQPSHVEQMEKATKEQKQTWRSGWKDLTPGLSVRLPSPHWDYVLNILKS